MKVDETLDCLGLLCPLPIAQTASKFKSLPKGQTLEVLSDDMGIKSDMPAWCRTTGNEFMGIEEEDGRYKVYIKKTQD